LGRTIPLIRTVYASKKRLETMMYQLYPCRVATNHERSTSHSIGGRRCRWEIRSAFASGDCNRPFETTSESDPESNWLFICLYFFSFYLAESVGMTHTGERKGVRETA